MPTESVHATTMSARQQSTSAKHRAILKQPRNQLIFAANQTKLTHLMASHAIQLLPSTFTNMSAAFTPASTMAAAFFLMAYMPVYFWMYSLLKKFAKSS
jgi:hypothetical protein